LQVTRVRLHRDVEDRGAGPGFGYELDDGKIKSRIELS
jgi:hypothetical protein